MNTQSGRSMVEMLGVLAIIGVLSVGAIAGYSKAMMKYKLNKQAEQYNTLINAVARNVRKFDDINTGGTQIINRYFIKMGEIPTEMIKNDGIVDVFNQRYAITVIKDTTTNSSSVNLSVMSAPALKIKSAESLEICRNMLITAKENADSIASISSVTRNDDDTDYMANFFLGDKLCAAGWAPCLKNLTLDTIYNFCTDHYGRKYNEFKVSWT
ncbi:MAG: type II secretion system protein [Alphaproteobacteria bacterium]|nr:type II secretion system protein [Alphaproteobacteria bacterium]